jgi:hypothetical protein
MRPTGWIRPPAGFPALAVLALLSLPASALAVDRTAEAPSEAPPVSSADPFRWSDQADRRALNGHYFLPSEVVRDPFASTHFGSGTAFGFGRFRVQGTDDQGNDVDLRLKLVAIAQALDLQVGIGHAGPAAFAVRLRAAGSAIVGIDAESALRAPLNVGYEYGAGFLAKAWGNRYFQAGLAFDFDRVTRYLVSPLAAIQNSIDRQELTTAGLLTKQTYTDLQPSLSLAVSPWRVAGLVATLRYTYELADRGADSQVLDLGLNLGFDLGAVSILPLGIQGIYQMQKELTGAKKIIHYGGGGLFYTGRPNLALGVEAVVTRSSPAAGVSQLLVEGQFRLRYYW